MTIGTGTGNTISFSTIRDFYGDTNPVAISDFNRNTSNDTLVDATFTGASTATTGTSSQTVDDFAVTVTEVDGSLTTSSLSIASFRRVTVTAQHSFVTMTISGSGQAIFSYHPNPGTGNSVQLLSTSLGGDGEPSTVTYTFRCPQFNSGDATPSDSNTYAAGMEVIANGINTGTAGFRAVEHDITFQNNSSTGDTYTLTSNSTGGSSKTAYAAGDSFLAQNNGSSNQFLLAYDNVTGSGSGTAGDIGVTVASGSGIAASTTVNGATNTATVTAPSSAFSYVDVTLTSTNNDPSGNRNVTAVITRNGTQVASAFNTEGLATATYSGTIAANDVFTGSGASNSGNNALTINFKNPDKVITYQNNGSSSITLGSSSTGGARTIAASASATVQPGGSTNNQDWEVHFNTGSGDCNVGIPTTIGVGNPVNMDLFNTVTTPVG